jgi:CDP-diacylglycerol pyrophosphatase
MLVNVFSHRRTVLFLILIVILIAVGVFVFKWCANSNALWQIISRQCLPNQRASQHPEPCIKIDEIAGFVMLKDRIGLLQFLLMPVAKISGIEDPILLYPRTPIFFGAGLGTAFLHGR